MHEWAQQETGNDAGVLRLDRLEVLRGVALARSSASTEAEVMGLEVILGGALAAVLAVLGAFFAGRRKGRVGEKEKQENERNQEYRRTRKRVDEAVRRADDRPADERLREQGKLRD